MSRPYRSGFVAISGRPNVGKSSLMNYFLGKKLSITTPKPQTTRNRITGILTEGDTQVVFIDSPGITRVSDELTKSLFRTATRIMHEADLVLFLADVSRYAGAISDEALTSLAEVTTPVILTLNKIDTIRKPMLLPLIDGYRRKFEFAEIIPVSVMLGKGMDLLFQTISKYLPDNPPFYDEEMLSELPLRFFIGEFVREKIFELLYEEVPYSIAVKVEHFRKKTSKLYIKANIYVERESQKGIVIGKNGGTLKRVGLAARNSIEAFLEEQVYLELWVKVRPKWSSDPRSLKEFGYQ